MEELLPLLIGVIWIAYAWYSKGQKDKRRPARGTSGEETSEREPSILEQILLGQEIRLSEPDEEDIILEEEPKPVREYERIQGFQDNKKYKPATAPFLNSELSKFKGEGVSQGKQKDISSFLRDEEEPYGNEFDVEDFDLRKAVIYSEILNPPYIDYK